MKKTMFAVLLFAASIQSHAMAWEMKSDKIVTRWASEVTPENAWQSYPRPQLVREEWTNLNGLWDYAVTPIDQSTKPSKFDGEILVPYAIESALSGVQRSFLPTDKLWYRKVFTLDKQRGKLVKLHFGAVDYSCTVWVNGKQAGSHVGGNNNFTLDITNLVKRSGEQVVELAVVDPTDSQSTTRGKQQLNQRGIWYTPVSGIWKSVWVETVSPCHINQILATSDIEKKEVTLDFNVAGAKGKEQVVIELLDGDKVVAKSQHTLSAGVKIAMPNATLWTPETPQLYHYRATLMQNGKVVDSAKSYFAMREMSVAKDECGYSRVALNGKPIFQFGTLDQGWWPDGLLTPPTEEAMLWDMEQLKAMGFNTIRKHIKVEPELYYYYADSLGLMVWQDMVSGFKSGTKDEHVGQFEEREWNATEEHSAKWQGELFEMIDCLRFYPSITTWVVFNEGWGQHKSVEIINKVEAYDESRIINGVSGWRDMAAGDMYDVHNYPCASMMAPANIDGRISVIGEFGGYGWSIDGHLWNPDMRNWGYKSISGAMELMENYGRLLYDLEPLVAQGLSAAIYTQTTDVEGEVNGLITYDREVVKIPASLLHKMQNRLYNVAPATPKVLVDFGFRNPSKNDVKRDLTVNGKELKGVTLPYEITGKPTVSSQVTFTADSSVESLSMWVNIAGKVKVSLNGVVILEQDMKSTKHGNHFNVSDYAHLIHVGENTLTIEGKQDRVSRFDYGLMAY